MYSERENSVTYLDRVFEQVVPPGRINRIDRILLDIDVRVPAHPAALHAFDRVSAQEPSSRLVVVPRTQVVEAEAVRPLAAIEEVVWRRAGAGNQAAEGVKLISVGDGARHVGQKTDVAVAVIAVEARRPRAADLLVLGDPLQAIGI